MTAAVRRGSTFTHDRFRQQIPGVRCADSPFEAMVVTRVTATTVWYGPDDGTGRGGWLLDRADFERRFSCPWCAPDPPDDVDPARLCRQHLDAGEGLPVAELDRRDAATAEES